MEINNTKRKKTNSGRQIIAVVGMAGSGKSEAVKYLVKKLDCKKVYFGEATFDRLKKDGLELNYENEKITREKIRAELGMGAYALLSLPKIKHCLKENSAVVLESLYSWEEYKILKNEFKDEFYVLAVFASPSTRFERLKNRLNERPMSGIEEFITRDYSELENLEKGSPIARADWTVVNESDIVTLHEAIDNLPIFK